MNALAIRSLLASLIVLAGGSLAFGQAGSVGGVIGKTDKSVTGRGTETQAEPTTRSKRQRPVGKGNSSQSSAASVAGSWHWSAECSGTHWDGTFDLIETSPGQFGGSFNFNGKISDGHVNGASISFTRTHLTGVQYWRGQLTGRQIKGTISGGGSCTWDATRK